MSTGEMQTESHTWTWVRANHDRKLAEVPALTLIGSGTRRRRGEDRIGDVIGCNCTEERKEEQRGIHPVARALRNHRLCMS